MGMPAMAPAGRECECRISGVPAMQSPDRPRRKQREQDAFGEGMPHDPRTVAPPAPCSKMSAAGAPAAPSMRLATLAQTISSTNPVPSSDPQPVLVLFAQTGDAGAARSQEQGFAQEVIRAITGRSSHPSASPAIASTRLAFSLDESAGFFRAGLDHTRLDAADQFQPVSIVLVQIGIAFGRKNGWVFSGRNKSGGVTRRVSPRNPGEQCPQW